MAKKLKIAVFHNLMRGGAIKALYDHIVYLKSKGHSVDVFIFEDSEQDFVPLDEISDNYNIYPMKRSKWRILFFNIMEKILNKSLNKNDLLFLSFKDIEKSEKIIANDINSGDYDIVFSEQDILVMSPYILKYVEKPLVYYCQQPLRNEKILNLLKSNVDTKFSKLLKKFYDKKFDVDIENASYAKHILVNSYFSHETLLKVYGQNSQVSYLGVDTNLFYPMNIKRKNFILSVGILRPHKGFDFILKSLSHIDKNLRPDFLIVTYSIKEDWLNYLKNLANEYDVNLNVLNNIPYEDLVKLYNETKLFVFTPYLEPFGLVPLEALACGTPVICVKEGGPREIVKHNENGFLLPRNEKVFAEGISELLTNQELWNKFSKNGPEYVRSFWTLEHQGQRLEEHLYRILEEEKEK